MIAIDVARFVALAGMFAAHTWDRNLDNSHTLIGELVAGRAAALFAVLAGIGLTFVTRRALDAGNMAIARRLLVGRGAALLVVGLTLGLLGTNVFVIIAYYGLLFWVLAPIIALRNRWLVLIAAVLAVVGPVVNVFVRVQVGAEYEIGTPSWVDLLRPVELVRALVVTGIYPAITWAVYGIVGILIGRSLVGRDGVSIRRFGARLATLGAVFGAAGWAASSLILFLSGRENLASDYRVDGTLIVDLLLSDSRTGSPLPGNPYWLAAATPHSGTLPDLAITIGIACVVIGLCLALFATASPLLRRLATPFAAAGAAPLTVYAVHIVLTVVIPWVASATGASSFEFVSSAGLYAVHLLVAILIGSTLHLLHARGPLEVVVTAIGLRFAHGRPSFPARQARD